jgi:hypothetical protein
VCRSGSCWCCILSRNDTSTDEEEESGNVTGTFEIEDVLGISEIDYRDKSLWK